MRGRESLRALTARISNAFTSREILGNPFVSAKILPLGAGARYAVLTRPPTTADVPTPPRELWERWGDSLERYLSTGQIDVDRMLRTLNSAGVGTEALNRVLDFGCAEGRMLRFFPRTGDSELWGVDVNAERIAWAKQNLAPPLRFITTTTAPHLPFEDNYFDLVYCLSVFTHISDLADAWFLELLRVLRPGGHLYTTVHDEHTVELLLGRYRNHETHSYLVDLLRRFDEETGTLSQEWCYFAILADPAAQVFYSSDYLVGKWSEFAECRAVVPEASEYQTAVVFQKSSR
jgi:SAM-dependent methyltransferase